MDDGLKQRVRDRYAEERTWGSLEWRFVLRGWRVLLWDG